MTDRVILNQAAINQLLKTEGGPVGKDLLRRAVNVETAAKRYCPVDTGRLRASIEHDLGIDSKGLFARIGSNVEYAIFVEAGTRYQHGQPYLRPALREATR